MIRAVATHDDVARVALCEHPSWAPLHVLLGLISCSIIVPLKADLVLTLAALGKSVETAVQLWNTLEASQIISTIPTTASFVNRGIVSFLFAFKSLTYFMYLIIFRNLSLSKLRAEMRLIL